MRTKELKEIYEALAKETSNLNVLANIDLWRERTLEAGHLRTMIDISEAVDRLESCLINSRRNHLLKSEIFQLQNTIEKLSYEYEELKNTDVFDRVVKRLSEAFKEDKPLIKLRNITQEEVDKMLDDASRIKMGDGTHLKTVDLRGYDLTGISFRGRTLSRVLFDNSCLNNADFIRAKMTGCSFVAAIMNEVCFRAADIRNCSFCNARMKGFDAIMSKIYLSSFEGANLEDAEFTSASINNSVFDDAKMRAAKVNLATIGDCSFVDCDLFVVDFSEAYLNNRSIELIRKARIFNLENLDR
jgi:pentapeptide repeat protein